MKCKLCDRELMIANSNFESKVGSEDVEVVQKLVCTNQDCANYCGKDINNPDVVAEVVRTKV